MLNTSKGLGQKPVTGIWNIKKRQYVANENTTIKKQHIWHFVTTFIHSVFLSSSVVKLTVKIVTLSLSVVYRLNSVPECLTDSHSVKSLILLGENIHLE